MSKNLQTFSNALMTAAAVMAITWPVSAAAQSAAGTDTGQIETVVVTGALQRSEIAKDAPIAVSTFNEQEIKDAGITRPGDYLALTPNVTFSQTTDAGESIVNIRGVTQQRDDEPPFAYVVDGILLPNPNTFNQDLTDISNIEVVKGPLGSIYGRNAVGGAILVNTKKPTDQFEAMAKAGYEFESQEYTLGGFASGPIADHVYGRMTANYSKRNGFFDNLTRNTKEDPLSQLVLRGRIIADLASNLELDVEGGYGKINGNAFSFNAQLSPTARFPTGVDTGNTSVPFVGNLKSFDRQKRWNLSAKLTWTLKPGVLTAYVAHDDLRENMGGEGAVDLALFGAFPPGPVPFFTDPNAIFGYGPTNRDGSQFQERNQRDTSAEIRFTSNSDQRLRYIAGAYFLKFDRNILLLTGDFGTGTGIATAPVLHVGDPGVSGTGGNNSNTAWAMFGQVSYDIIPDLEASVAMRFDREDRKNTNTVPGGPNAPLGFQRKQSFERLQPRFSLRYKMTDETSLYATYGEAFRSGGFNALGTRAIIQTLDDPTTTVTDNFPKETTKSYEVGAKSTFFNGRLNVNVAGFYTKVNNAHFFRFFPISLARPITIVDENDIKGLELDFNARVTDELSLFGGAGYLHSNIKKDVGDPLAVGKTFPYTPSHSFLLGAQYEKPLWTDVSGLARIEWQQTGKTWFDVRNTPGTARPTYDLVNLRVGLEGVNWEFALYSRNIFNKQYNVDAVPLPIDAFKLNFNFVTRGQPRTVGIELTYRT